MKKFIWDPPAWIGDNQVSYELSQNWEIWRFQYSKELIGTLIYQLTICCIWAKTHMLTILSWVAFQYIIL
jgi:hypothetical protein